MLVNVVIGVAEQDGKILLIKRERGDFVGLWGLPGGKVEEGEHLDTAIERELFEETGIKFQFEKVLGVSTEIMHDTGSTSMLYCCKLKNSDIRKYKGELTSKWFDIEELPTSKEVIESDLLFIKEFYKEKNNNYLKLDCYRDDNGKYYWK